MTLSGSTGGILVKPTHILSIDQGTTSTRSIVFDAAARSLATAQAEFTQHYPQSGWVEHDPEDIWRDTLATARAAIAGSGVDYISVGAITHSARAVDIGLDFA